MDQQVVLVTGGAAGIGEATVRAFLEEKAIVCIWDVNEEKGRELTEELTAKGHQVYFAKVDVTSLEKVENAVAQIVKDVGSIDVLINNAGITMDRSFLKMDAATWQK